MNKKKIYEFNEMLGVDGTASNDTLTNYLGKNINHFPLTLIETNNKKAFSGQFPQLTKVIKQP